MHFLIFFFSLEYRFKNISIPGKTAQIFFTEILFDLK